MALDRQMTIGSSPGTKSGNSYMDEVQEEVTGLWNYSRIPITVSGTNALSATPVPALTGALVDGMGFVFRAAATNTSTSMTLNVGTGAFNLLTRHGVGPAVGSIVIGGLYEAIWVQGAASFMLTSYLAAVGFDDRPSFRNLMGANGGCEIWQRGTSIAVGASTSPYTCDRWYLATSANQASTVSRGAFADTRSEWCALVQRNNGQTGTGQMVFGYPFTLSECIQMRGQQVTLTARLSPGANWSPAGGVLGFQLQCGTGSEKKAVAGFTSITYVINSSINLTTTVNISPTSASTVPLNTTQAELLFYWTPVGTAGAADYFAIDDVQLECGTVPTQFEYAPFDYCLRLCQAHYAKTFPYGTAPAQAAGLAGSISGDKDVQGLITAINTAFSAIPASGLSGLATGAYGASMHWRFPVRMRTTPSIISFNPSAANANIRLPDSGVDATITVSPYTSTGDSGVTVRGAQNGEGSGYIHLTADAGL